MYKFGRAILILWILVCLGLLTAVWACDPPSGGINSPPDGATVLGTTTIELAATSETEVLGVDIYVDGQLLASLTPKIPQTENGHYQGTCEYEWDTTGLPDGTHEMYAKVRAKGRADGITETITITVGNEKQATEDAEGTAAAEEGDVAEDETAS